VVLSQAVRKELANGLSKHSGNLDVTFKFVAEVSRSLQEQHVNTEELIMLRLYQVIQVKDESRNYL
jgi:hypothetical protein